MGYSKVYIHLVWTTSRRQPLLTKNIRGKIFKHIKQNAKLKGILVDHIGGYSDHVHCLVVLSCDQSMSKVVQLLKGESSHWINQLGLTGRKFKWQEEYYAVSVGIRQLNIVRNYIRNQEQHHLKKNLEKELKLFEKLYGFHLKKGL